MDIRHYVKIKKIPGGDISECSYIDGLVCRKNVASKKMKVIFKNPSILLLSCAVEYKIFSILF